MGYVSGTVQCKNWEKIATRDWLSPVAPGFASVSSLSEHVVSQYI